VTISGESVLPRSWISEADFRCAAPTSAVWFTEPAEGQERPLAIGLENTGP
jgi:hypothetical protein